MAQREHPREPTVVDARLDREKDADDDDQEGTGDHAERQADRAGDLAERPKQRAEPEPALAADSAGGRDAVALEQFGQRSGLVRLDQAEACEPAEQAQQLGLDGHAKLAELRREFGAGEDEHPGDEAEAGERDKGQPEPARQRQPAPDQTRPAIEQHREHHAADDQQQRLAQDDQGGDEQGEADPHRSLLEFGADQRIAEIGGAGLFDVRVRHRAIRPSSRT